MQQALSIGRNGPRASPGNILKILRDDPRWAGAVRLNRMGRRVELRGEELHEDIGPVAAQEWIEDVYGLPVSVSGVGSALVALAGLALYHPVAAWLAEIPAWDGAARIREILTRVLGCADDVLLQKFIRRFLIGAVARALDPGCKVDTALILVGVQGSKKSSFFRELFGLEWFADSPIPIGNKDAFLLLALVWGYEAAELESLNRTTAEATKQFLSSSRDTFRAPYQRGARSWPRHAVMCGTTDRDDFLGDPAGSRRFWPIAVPNGWRIDVEFVRQQREMLWAEALHAYRLGESWWLEPDEDQERAMASAPFRDVDAWEDVVLGYAARHDEGFRTVDLCHEALGMETDKVTRQVSNRIGAILRTGGWRQSTLYSEDGKKFWGWSLRSRGVIPFRRPRLDEPSPN